MLRGMGRPAGIACAAAIIGLLLATGLSDHRVSATSCMVAEPSELLTSEEPGLTLFIGTVTVSADPVQFTVDAVLKGELDGAAEVRIVDDFSAGFRQEPLIGSVMLVAAFNDAGGILTAGPCTLPQTITSRDEAAQLVALVPGARVRSAFEHLPPASMLRLGVGAPADPAPVAPAPSIAATPPAVADVMRPPEWAPAAVVVGGGSLALALWLIARRNRAALAAAAVTGAVLALAVAVGADVPPAAMESSRAPADSPTASVEVDPLTLPSPPRAATRDGPSLTRLLDRAGLSCVTDESALDNWRMWECGGIATAEVEVLVSMYSNFADDNVISYSVSYTHRGDEPILEPIDPAEFGPFTALVMDEAERDLAADWLASTWAISTIGTEFDAFHVRRSGAGLTFDLRFSAP
jgi:hypothetical protein